MIGADELIDWMDLIFFQAFFLPKKDKIVLMRTRVVFSMHMQRKLTKFCEKQVEVTANMKKCLKMSLRASSSDFVGSDAHDFGFFRIFQNFRIFRVGIQPQGAKTCFANVTKLAIVFVNVRTVLLAKFVISLPG